MTSLTHYHQIQKIIQEKALACGRHPEEITLLVVSKTYPVECLQAIYREGARLFGESRVQEGLSKMPLMPSDCQWHLIGSLQSNKIAKAISYFHLIHSVDTPLLAQKISQASQAKGTTTSILLQVKTSAEKTKHGLNKNDWRLALDKVIQLPHIRIEGLMTMAPYTEDQQVIRSCFQQLFQCRKEWQELMKDPEAFRHLSMGMSHDYLIAIEEGATLLRIGTAIFGSRSPH